MISNSWKLFKIKFVILVVMLIVAAILLHSVLRDDNDSNWDYLGHVDAIEFHGGMSIHGDTMTVYTDKGYAVRVKGDSSFKYSRYWVYINKDKIKLKLVPCTWCEKPVYIFSVLDSNVL